MAAMSGGHGGDSFPRALRELLAKETSSDAEQIELIDDEVIGPFCWSAAEDAAGAARANVDAAVMTMCEMLAGYLSEPPAPSQSMRALVARFLAPSDAHKKEAVSRPPPSSAQAEALLKHVPAATENRTVTSMGARDSQAAPKAPSAMNDDIDVLADMFPDRDRATLAAARRRAATLDDAVMHLLESAPTPDIAVAVPPAAPVDAGAPPARMAPVLSAPREDHDLERVKKNIIASYMLQEVSLNEAPRPVPVVLPKQVASGTGTSKVVSTRGERYVVEKSESEADLKHTYVNLRPLRQYRFH